LTEVLRAARRRWRAEAKESLKTEIYTTALLRNGAMFRRLPRSKASRKRFRSSPPP
jgi:hypothetical protein